ncbi:MAG: YlqD family protein [Cyanobacteria bacterium]|nr:YlqD family protein [Cyanobacteriota bacterium]MDW8200694.1 YlqD family protein [Cyanobacteriota bacterium SKYGB_h_bin112]
MDVSNKLLLKRTVQMRTIVTPEWKEQTQQQFQMQINQIDGQVQQMELQARQAIAEIQKQSLQPPSPEVTQQIENIQIQVNNNKSQLLEQKNQLLQQINRVQLLELEQEVDVGQLESFFYLEKGDNVFEKMQVEVLLRNGIVQDIRGKL